MNKINFKKEHLIRLQELACEALFNNTVVSSTLGQNLNIIELLHTTSINQLNNIKAALSKRIEKLESADEWVGTDSKQLESARKIKELVNLIVGYKRYNLEIKENERKKEELTEKLVELRESTKTPEDRIKEIEAELASLNTAEDFQ